MNSHVPCHVFPFNNLKKLKSLQKVMSEVKCTETCVCSNSKTTEQKTKSQLLRTVQDYKDFYSYQQAILIAFVNTLCSVTVKRQRKRTTISTSLPEVLSLNFDTESIDVAELTQRICMPSYEDSMKVLAKQTAFRRYEKNRKIFVQHLLMDILSENGFFFNSKLARKTDKTYRLERINEIFYDYKPIMNMEELIVRGNAINNYICDNIKDRNTFTLQKNDKAISDIILKPLSYLPSVDM